MLSKLVKVSVLQEAKDKGIQLKKVDLHSPGNQLDNSYTFIGFTTRQTLKKLHDDGLVSNYEMSKFFDEVRHFYTRAIEYIIEVYPLNDPFL